jgi:hypothetical protein
MGEMADFTLECMEYDEMFNSSYIPKQPQCRGCKTKNVSWDKVAGKWLLVNPNGAPHKCGKYEWPFECLEYIALEKIKKSRLERDDRAFEKSMEHNGIKKVIPFMGDEEVLNLYTRWVEYAKSDEVCNSNGYRMYDGKIAELKQELLNRFKKSL